LSNRRLLGRLAEDEAAEYLLSKGFTIVTRRCTLRSGEIDIVALEGDVLVFVEVKMRRAKSYRPEEAIGISKLQALERAAEEYVRAMDETERETRFDLVAIDSEGLRHYRDVFRA
jgi:putative endonuclease